jgi:hypothetical protein
MSKLAYPSPLRHNIVSSRRWAYTTLDGAFVVAKVRNGERPACYARQCPPVGVFEADDNDQRAAKRGKSENGSSRQ